MKRVLSLILSVLMLVSTLPAGMVAMADEKDVTVQFSVCDGGMFTMQPSDIDVSADWSDEFAEAVGFNDKGDEPTILDAIIAAHIAMFGADFMDYAPFSAPGGFIASAFGEETSAISYRLNGGMSDDAGNYYNLNTAVSDNDYVEFMFYQDTSFWSDTYLTFAKRTVIEPHKNSVELTLYYEGYDANWNATLLPAANVAVTVDWEPYGTTDKDGKIVISDLSKGPHYISTEPECNGAPAFLPYTKVVIEKRTEEHISDRLAGASAFVSSSVKLDVDSATDVLLCAKANSDWGGNNKLEFFDNVLECLNKNRGKIVKADGTENIATYGAVIEMLRMYGYDTKDFGGYDVEAAFKNMKYDVNAVNPYDYRFAIRGAVNDEHANALAKELINNYYTKGKGMNYWGYSCDNTATFLYAIAPVSKNFADITKDAISLIEAYKTEKGYYYSTQYKDPNADSTGVALAAFSAIGDMQKASTAYAMLINEFESDKNVGVMNYYGEENLFATKDGMLGIIELENAVNSANYDGHCVYNTTTKATTTKDGSIKTTCVICGNVSTKKIYYPKTVTLSTTKYTYNGTVRKPSVTVKGSDGKTISSSNYTVTYPSGRKNVGKYTVKVTFKGNYTGSKSVSFTINPKNTSAPTLKGIKKGFKVSWKKQATQTTGYQIQYSTNSVFRNAKISTVTSNKTLSRSFTKKKSKVKYYVRIRTYKTVSGTRYYSNWSSTKTVKTK